MIKYVYFWRNAIARIRNIERINLKTIVTNCQLKKILDLGRTELSFPFIEVETVVKGQIELVYYWRKGYKVSRKFVGL